MKNTNRKIEVKETKTAKKTSGTRYVSPDGMIFYSREEYLDYMAGL